MFEKSTTITPKSRLLNVLKGETVDRPPVICPGGMMNAAVSEVVKPFHTNHNLTAEGMVLAAKAVYDLTGFENYGVPFCMTCEAEPLNPHMDEGSPLCEPKITAYVPWPEDDTLASDFYNLETLKCHEVLKAIATLKNDSIPVFGNITGPISTATSIVDPIDFLKALRKAPDKVQTLLTGVQRFLITYAKAMIDAGADVIVISDPTATGEILGSKYFETVALPLYQAFSEAIDVPLILHICGNMTTALTGFQNTGASALSFDAMVSVRQLRAQTELPLMGNINTLLLQNGPCDKIVSAVNYAIEAGIAIVSPACGLGMSTPIEHLKTMTEAVKKHG